MFTFLNSNSHLCSYTTPAPPPPFKKKYYTAIFVLQNNSNLFITYSFLQQIMITITCTWLKTKIYFKKVNVKNTTLC